MAIRSETGILILGYGAPQSLEEVAPFMRSVTGGASIERSLPIILERYKLIGGKSPLVDFARGIAQKLEDHYEEQGDDYPVKIGMIHSKPSIEDAVHEFVLEGVKRIIAISLSPYYSSASNGLSYERAAEMAAEYPGIELIIAPEVGLTEPYLRGVSASLADEFDAADSLSDEVPIAFVAHSIQEDVASSTDQAYEASLRASADAIADSLYLMKSDEHGYACGSKIAFGTEMPPRPWTLVYCSRGMRGGEWLGPSLSDFIEDAATEEREAIIVVPLGFATDHLETLYDLDIEASKKAEERGIKLLRAKALNTSDELIEAFILSISSVIED